MRASMPLALQADGDWNGLALRATFALLDALARSNSLLAAARRLGISYRSTWSRVTALETALGQPVAVKTKGHGTVLTPYGRALHATLAEMYDRLGPVLAAEAARTAEALRGLDVRSPAPLRLAASHDPLLLRIIDANPSIELAVAGSLDALAHLRAGTTEAAGFHYGSEGPVPPPFDALFRDPDLTVRPLFRRQQGLMLPQGNPHGVTGVRDIARLGLRFVNRQRGAGTRIWFERLCAEAGLETGAIRGAQTEEFTHQAVAALIATGTADAGMGTPVVAERFGLAFHPLGWETYYLAARTTVDETVLAGLTEAADDAAGATLGYQSTACG
ncbi:LuxR family transcriptional regulator [Methylobacterium sp. Leaf104]|uniref:helix-turn-helix transcriptional regulator n=1 Tax=Methylobacterium TaxID=407 RepID=UPI0006F49225|nr:MULTISPECIES: substrate-binding domain-containing protein [Methylobacterium]KQP42936.1 LuxR family transcriptional regulator [Methylobacterium sp. Leaf104]MCI9878448.1 helix-turn-helix transcriptional regulator [Methylobacterium goesingense]